MVWLGHPQRFEDAYIVERDRRGRLLLDLVRCEAIDGSGGAAALDGVHDDQPIQGSNVAQGFEGGRAAIDDLHRVRQAGPLQSAHHVYADAVVAHEQVAHAENGDPFAALPCRSVSTHARLQWFGPWA